MTRPLTVVMLMTLLGSLLAICLGMLVSEPTNLDQQTKAELKLLLSQ